MTLRRIAIVGAFIALFALVGGVAWASIPDGSGVIHGCRKNSDGTLRVIDSATQTCMTGWTPLNWSQTGPTGPAGAAGTNGVSGYEVVEVRQDIAGNTYAVGQRFVQPAYCPSGKVALGGGGEGGPGGLDSVLVSEPIVDGNGSGWQFGVTISPGADTSMAFAFITRVTCAAMA